MRIDPASTATAVLTLVGGPANVTSVTHCMTRLRLTLADPTAVDEAALRAVPEVLGLVSDGPDCQVVLGPGVVEEVTEAVTRTVTETAARADEGGKGGTEQETGVRTALRRIANVFVPLIPALIGCGILAEPQRPSAERRLAPLPLPALSAIASAFLALIAVFVGINTAREFGGTPVLGGAAAAVVVHPGVSKVTAFGAHLSPGQGGVLGALAAAFLATRVEKWVRGRVPGALDVLLTPTVTVLVSGLVTLYGLMYAAGAVAAAIGTAVNWLLTTAGAAAGLVLGGLFLPW
ncbi:PTS transporter subunit EIIB [Streptomyces lasalocidi]